MMPTYEEIQNALKPESGLRVVLAADERWRVADIRDRGSIPDRLIGLYVVGLFASDGSAFSRSGLLSELKIIPAPPKRWRLRKDVEIVPFNDPIGTVAMRFTPTSADDRYLYWYCGKQICDLLFEEVPEGE